MKQLSGEIFECSLGRNMLVYDEQRDNISVGERVVFDNQIFCVAEIVHSSNPEGKWTVRLERPVNNQQPLDDKLCRCISALNGRSFIKGEIYQWGWIIDGMKVYGETEEEWSAGEIEFYKHFAPINGK